MEYYVTKKAGSVLFRKPRRRHVLAGEHIPAEFWAEVREDARAELLRSGMVQGFQDPDSVRLDEPEPDPNAPVVGVGNNEFMPEAHVQPGKRRDKQLDELAREQRRATLKAKAESEVDPDLGGSADGVVRVELPPEEDDEEFDDSDLTAEELAEIRRMEEGS